MAGDYLPAPPAGCFYLDGNGQFKPVSGMSSTCWSILSVGDSMLVATTHGAFLVDVDGQNPENTNKQRLIDQPVYALLRSQINPDRIWAGMKNQLAAISRSGATISGNGSGKWDVTNVFKDISGEIRGIAESPQGNLWLKLRAKHPVNVRFPNPAAADLSKPDVTRYGKEHGLPEKEVSVIRLFNRIIFCHGSGDLPLFNPAKSALSPMISWEKPLPVVKPVKKFSGWRRIKRIISGFIPNAGIFRQYPGPMGLMKIRERPYSMFSRSQVNAIYPDPDGKVIWFAIHDGIIRYDTSIIRDDGSGFQALIREVKVDGNDFFKGTYPDDPW